MTMNVTVKVNGQQRSGEVEPRLLLVHFIRDVLGLTGTHVGCDTSQCGACTIIVNGKAVKSCTLLAVQAEGHAVRTVESLAGPSGELNLLQQAFHESHALQCGFCTPGFLMSLEPFVETADPATLDERTIREALAGNLCRCTGYQNIVAAVRLAVERRHGAVTATTSEA